MNKTCFKCGKTKDIDQFYRHPSMTDGHLGKCKECTRRDVAMNYRNNREHYSLRERMRSQCVARKEKKREYLKRMKERHPEKFRARCAVNNAVRDGRLTRPSQCAICQSSDRIQAHHTDYAKPFDVQWLCFKCHREHGHGQIVTAA